MSRIARFGALASVAALSLTLAACSAMGTGPTGNGSATPVPNEAIGPVELIDGNVALKLTVPAGAKGWSHEKGDLGIDKPYGADGLDHGPAIVIYPMTGAYVDPCADHTAKEPASSIADLIGQLGNQAGLTSGPVTDVTISGYQGKYVDTTVTADITKCDDGDGFWLWAAGFEPRYVQGAGEQNRMYAIDVDGMRLTFDVRIPASTTDEDRKHVEEMLAGLEIAVSGPSASASAEASPSAVAEGEPTLRPNALPPGPTTLVDPDFGVATMTVQIPEGGSGWTSDGLGLWKDYGPTGLESGPVIIVWPGGIHGTYADPCTDHTLNQPYPEGVDALIEALGNQPGISSEPAVDVTISGFKGKYVDTTVTADITKCGDGNDGFWLWNSKNTDRRYVQDTGEVNRMYAIDVDGKIHTLDVRLPPATTDADRAEVLSMLDTLELTPGVSASPTP